MENIVVGLNFCVNECNEMILYPKCHDEIINKTLKIMEDMNKNPQNYIHKNSEENIKTQLNRAKDATIEVLKFKIENGTCYLTKTENKLFDKNMTELDKIFIKYISYYYTIIQIVFCEFFQD